MNTTTVHANASFRRRQKIITTALYTILAILITFLICVPLIAVIGTSFKMQSVVLTSQTLLPRIGEWSLENFANVIFNSSYVVNLGNSIFITLIATALCVFFSCLAGYAMANFQTKLIKGFSVFLFILQMFPAMLLLIPMFVLYSRYGMVNSRISVSLYYTASNLGFNILLIRSFYENIPRELTEAGMIDGCSRVGVFFKIIMPISLPGAATIGIMTFLNCWNEYTFASLLLKKSELTTFTVGIQTFVSQEFTNWGYLTAGSVIALVPAFIFLLFAQRYLVEGMTAGAVKG